VEIIDVKTFFYVFLFWSRFTFLTFCFYFPNVFFIFKNVGKVQSGKEINKKQFQSNSNEIDLRFFVACRILKISLLAQNDDSFCKTKLNGIFRVALKDISWASSVELNTLRRGNVFLLRLQTFFKNFCHVFNVF